MYNYISTVNSKMEDVSHAALWSRCYLHYAYENIIITKLHICIIKNK